MKFASFGINWEPSKYLPFSSYPFSTNCYFLRSTETKHEWHVLLCEQRHCLSQFFFLFLFSHQQSIPRPPYINNQYFPNKDSYIQNSINAPFEVMELSISTHPKINTLGCEGVNPKNGKYPQIILCTHSQITECWHGMKEEIKNKGLSAL